LWCREKLGNPRGRAAEAEIGTVDSGGVIFKQCATITSVCDLPRGARQTACHE
jgi:hypothetical protein